MNRYKKADNIDAGDDTILDSSDKEYKKVYCNGRLGWVS